MNMTLGEALLPTTKGSINRKIGRINISMALNVSDIPHIISGLGLVVIEAKYSIVKNILEYVVIGDILDEVELGEVIPLYMPKVDFSNCRNPQYIYTIERVVE